MKLTTEQVRHFDDEGYLILRVREHQLVKPADVKRWAAECQSWPRVKGAQYMPYDEVTASGERILMRIESFVEDHKGFAALLLGSELRNILAQLTRDEMLLFKDKINFKLPGGNGFGAHLDAPAYDHIGELEHTTANLAIDDATVANGCLEVVPRSHRMDVELAEGGAISKVWEDAHVWVPVELSAGDLLIFGSHLAHRSASNNTSAPRASVYATYHNLSDGDNLRSRYYEDRRENFPPDHERIPGKDYGAGVKRYAFAAPFTKIEQPMSTPLASIQQALDGQH